MNSALGFLILQVVLLVVAARDFSIDHANNTFVKVKTMFCAHVFLYAQQFIHTHTIYRLTNMIVLKYRDCCFDYWQLVLIFRFFTLYSYIKL